MLFSSLTFLVFFLPPVIVGAAVLSHFSTRAATMLFLVGASAVFYAWNYPPYLLLLTTSIVTNFIIGRSLAESPSKPLLWLGICFNLGLLGWFKYAGFLADSISSVSGAGFSLGVIILPLAISFFTFQQIAYLVDIWKNKIRPGDFLTYAFFISFFPQLIAGPIVHYRELVPQLREHPFARFLSKDVVAGALLFSLGFAKKVLVADQLRFGADRLFEATAMGVEPSMLEAWVGMLAYGFQIYFDFSGYSDMALGLGRMFGLKLPVNFLSPYKAASIIDFWRRWNITLSHFLRDYLYYPLGGNKKGRLWRYANLFIVMLLGGLWHGANWTFVVWGGLHGLYLTINHAWRHFTDISLPKPLSIALTFGAATIAWVFFRADSFTDAFIVITAMAGAGTVDYAAFTLFSDMALLPTLLMVAGLIVWFVPNNIELVQRFEAGILPALKPRLFIMASGSLAAISIFTVFSAGTYEFLYFQF